MRRVHCLRPTTQPESIDVTANRIVGLRRLLGLFLVVYFQRQRHGQSKPRLDVPIL